MAGLIEFPRINTFLIKRHSIVSDGSGIADSAFNLHKDRVNTNKTCLKFDSNKTYLKFDVTFKYSILGVIQSSSFPTNDFIVTY